MLDNEKELIENAVGTTEFTKRYNEAIKRQSESAQIIADIARALSNCPQTSSNIEFQYLAKKLYETLIDYFETNAFLEKTFEKHCALLNIWDIING